MENIHKKFEPEKKELSFKEQRIRKITSLYYSKPEVQKAIFEFSKNREICPRYFEGFGKRPDMFQYKDDILQLVKKGATSFHCSEEIWENPLDIETGMTEEQYNQIRTGWDLILDIDSKYIDYSKVLTHEIIKLLNFHGVKNIGLKFSGSKGFHIIIPWEAFPKKVNEMKTSDMFPEWPRIILQYINEKTKPSLIKEITKISVGNKYVRDLEASEEVIPDLVLVSPRHLFRMPYSLHEKTALASVVIDPKKIQEFQLNDANPLKVEVKDFYPSVEQGEASELLVQALDWQKEENLNSPEIQKPKGKFADFKPIQLENLIEEQFPPCVKNILKGIKDGKKRALFVLINLFRSVGMDKQELEKKINHWNEKNNPPLKKGYIISQLSWSYNKKPIMPPNCREFYKGIGVCIPDNLCNVIKNPVNYVVRKNFVATKKNEEEKKQKQKLEKEILKKNKIGKKKNTKNKLKSSLQNKDQNNVGN